LFILEHIRYSHIWHLLTEIENKCAVNITSDYYGEIRLKGILCYDFILYDDDNMFSSSEHEVLNELL